MSTAVPSPYTPTHPPLQPKLPPTNPSSAPPVHYNGDSSYWVQTSGSPHSALSTFIPFQQPPAPAAAAARPPASSASSSRHSSGSAPRSGSLNSAPAAGFVPVPPPAVSSTAVRRPLFVAAPPPLPASTARAGPPATSSPAAPAAPASLSALHALPTANGALTAPPVPVAAVFVSSAPSPSFSPFVPSRVPGLSVARAAHLSAAQPIDTTHTTTQITAPPPQPAHPALHPAATASHVPSQPVSVTVTPYQAAVPSPSTPPPNTFQYAHSPNSPGLLSASTTPVPSRPVSPALIPSIPASSIHARPATLTTSPLWPQPVAPSTVSRHSEVNQSYTEAPVPLSLPTSAAASVTEAATSTAAVSRPSRASRAASAVPTARRAHLIAKAKQLSEQRAQRQQQEIQRLAQLQASLSTTTQPSQASAHSQKSLSHELDPLIAADDALHTRYLLHTQQLQRKLAEQQDGMHELSQATLRLQHIIAADDHSNAALALSPAFYQQENALLQSHLTLLQQRLQEKEEEAALLSSMVVKKSARVSEVREEASVVVDEMRAAVKRLGADKERREREMREEREQLMSGLREMIDRCVRENEWMRLRLGEEGREEMERWKESEESRMEEREHDRQRMLHKERQREKDKEAEREREEKLQLQRLEEDRRREEERDSTRQQEANTLRQKEEETRRQQEELKQPEPEADSVASRPVAAHFIARPSTVLTTSSLSTVSSPVSATRRVHFRHPSASPTVFYEPAPSSAPPSPQPLPVAATSLQSQNELLPPLAAFQHGQHNSVAAQHFTLGALPASPAPAPPQPYAEPWLQSINAPSFPPSIATSSQPHPYPSTASTDDSRDFDSYFGGGVGQHEWSLQPQPPPAAAPITALTPVLQPQPSSERTDQPHRPIDPHPLAAPRDAFTGSTSQAAQPTAASSISDRVMGRIGGWMLGNVGRERVVTAAGGSGQHERQ